MERLTGFDKWKVFKGAILLGGALSVAGACSGSSSKSQAQPEATSPELSQPAQSGVTASTAEEFAHLQELQEKYGTYTENVRTIDGDLRASHAPATTTIQDTIKAGCVLKDETKDAPLSSLSAQQSSYYDYLLNTYTIVLRDRILPVEGSLPGKIAPTFYEEYARCPVPFDPQGPFVNEQLPSDQG